MTDRGNIIYQNDNFFLTDVDDVSRTTRSIIQDVKNNPSNISAAEPDDAGTTINPLKGTIIDTLPVENKDEN